MKEMRVSTQHLARGNAVSDKGRVLIVNEIEKITIPGTQQPGYMVRLLDPRTGKSTRYAASTQRRWTLWQG